MKATTSRLLLLIALCVSPSLLHAQGKWSTAPSLPTARDRLTSSVVDGKIYVIGGGVGFNTALSAVEVFDPSTNSWSTLPSMPTARWGLTSTAVNGKIYAIGGRDGDDKLITALEVFDPLTNSWSTAPSMPTGRTDLTSSVVNGKIYVIGGTTDFWKTDLSTVEIFDPSTNSWTTGPSLPVARFSHASSVVDGKIYVIGGQFNNDSYSEGIEVFDSTSNSWNTNFALPKTRSRLTSSVVNKKIYTFGGQHDMYYQSTAEAFDPSTNIWSAVESMPRRRSWITSSAVNGKIYVIGDGDGTVEVFDPGTSGVSEWLSLPTSILKGNNPNPAQSSTMIEFVLAETKFVKLEIFNALGVKVKSVLDELMTAGEHSVSVDLRDVPSGSYYYRIQAGERVETAKLSVVN